MGQIKNNINTVMEHPDVSRACKKLSNSALSLIYSFGESENFQTMVGMHDIFINLIKYINTNTEIFDANTREEYMLFALENIFKLLESENFRNGIISVEYIYRIIDKLSEAVGRWLFGPTTSYVYFFNIICNSKLSFTESDLNELYGSLGQEKMLISICNVLIENLKNGDEETEEAVYDYIYEGPFKGEEIGKIPYLFLLIIEIYMRGDISKDRFVSIVILINNFYNECKEHKKNWEEISFFVDFFADVLISKNFKKGIIPDTYLEEHSNCYYVEQLRTMRNLLTCEYYEEGFITEDYIKLVSNKEYIIITCMLDYILTGKISVEGNKYDVALGILNFDRKKELCDVLYSYIEEDDDIEGFKSVALNYLQYNLFFPKFDVKPLTKKRVPENDN